MKPNKQTLCLIFFWSGQLLVGSSLIYKLVVRLGVAVESHLAGDVLCVGCILCLAGSLFGNRKSKAVMSPSRKLDVGIYLLCVVLCQLFIVATQGVGFFEERIFDNWYFGILVGVGIGFIVCKVRPAYEEATGVWKSFLHISGYLSHL